MIVSLLCNSFEIIESSQNYHVYNGVNINSNVNASLIINSTRMKSKFNCLAVCNSNKECISSVYIESKANDNCILYNKQFDSNETTTTNNSKLFIKKSKKKKTKRITI